MLEYNTKHVYEDTYLSILLQVQSATKMNSINANFFMSTKMDIKLDAVYQLKNKHYNVLLI